MSLTRDQLEAEALNLSARDRADLAQRLFASLEAEDSPENPAARALAEIRAELER
ncbi:MAG: hypothetical protein M3409_01690 [Gemmatimonadota bacterium]|jgi:hypothetical protein|nr:hypothetical protein [Gemmatimonadota bacterium]